MNYLIDATGLYSKQMCADELFDMLYEGKATKGREEVLAYLQAALLDDNIIFRHKLTPLSDVSLYYSASTAHPVEHLPYVGARLKLKGNTAIVCYLSSASSNSETNWSVQVGHMDLYQYTNMARKQAIDDFLADN